MDLVMRLAADIGQRVDPTAIVVVEETAGEPVEEGATSETVFLVRHVERISLGTSYPYVAARVADIAASIEDRHPSGAKLWCVLDATGVGRPVVDLCTAALAGSRFRISAATFTATDRLEGSYRSSEIRVGKVWMVSRLQALLQTGRVKLPDTAEARALADELLDYEIRVTDTAALQAGAFRTGKHDDLVTALGLATLETSRRSRSPAMDPAAFGELALRLGQANPWDDGSGSALDSFGGDL